MAMGRPSGEGWIVLDPKVCEKGPKEVNLRNVVGPMVKNLECKAKISPSESRDTRTCLRIRPDVVVLIHVSSRERNKFYNPYNVYVDQHDCFSAPSLEGKYGWHQLAFTIWLSGNLKFTKRGL